MKLIVTGGAGFIGSGFIRHILQTRSDWQIVNFDALTYAGNLENLTEIENSPRYQFVHGSIDNRTQVTDLMAGGADAIVNFAAESHVDRSIMDAECFVQTNVVGTQVLLDAARKVPGLRFIQISTDEVYGTLGPEGSFTETSPLAPNSPYSASKAGADLLSRSYRRTYGMDVIVTRCCNNYGPYQFPEKLIPLMTLNAMQDSRLPVYGDGLYTRDWIHVADHSRAIEAVLEDGQPGSVYNIGADHEETNLDLVRQILAILGKPDSLIESVRDRPGHDRRYAVDASKLRRELGWAPTVSFERGLTETIEWYRSNRPWVDRVRTGAYQSYYRRMYGQRDRTLDEI